MAASLLPLAAIAALLVWGTFRSGGKQGGVFVNNNFGEVDIGERIAPDFAITTFAGDTLSLSDYLGKVVVLDFFASWCVPCRVEAPTLQQVSQAYADRGVQFVGIDIWDREEDATAYLAEFGITYPSGIDPDGKITIDYGVTGIPEKFFISPDGRIMHKFVGPADAENLAGILDDLLTGAAD